MEKSFSERTGILDRPLSQSFLLASTFWRETASQGDIEPWIDLLVGPLLAGTFLMEKLITEMTGILDRPRPQPFCWQVHSEWKGYPTRTCILDWLRWHFIFLLVRYTLTWTIKNKLWEDWYLGLASISTLFVGRYTLDGKISPRGPCVLAQPRWLHLLVVRYTQHGQTKQPLWVWC